MTKNKFSDASPNKHFNKMPLQRYWSTLLTKIQKDAQKDYSSVKTVVSIQSNFFVAYVLPLHVRIKNLSW